MQRIRTDTTRCTPDQHNITLLHVGAVLRHQHAIARRVAQRIDSRFLPREVCWFWHQLVCFNHRQVCEAAEVCFVTPNALVVAKHRVVVRSWVLIVDVIAMHRDFVARFPVAHSRAHAQHNTRSIAAYYVIRQVMSLCPFTFAGKSSERTKSRDRFKNTRPHCIEVDAASHHRNEYLVWCDLWHSNILNMHTLTWIFVCRRDTSKHFLFALKHNRCTVRDGDCQCCKCG